MRIGYSFWGFLFDGIQDTSDGGRIHRLPFLRALVAQGAQIICLQNNRDLAEAGHSVAIEGITFASSGFPDLDALIFEYRWKIPGRNCVADSESPSFTPDLQRQKALLAHYRDQVPTIIWDKDLKLQPDFHSWAVVAEAALKPRCGRLRLLFSYDSAIQQASVDRLGCYNSTHRTVDLVYIGNQYERDSSFKQYIDGSGALLGNRPDVYGNWTKYEQVHAANIRAYPHVMFHDRLCFTDLAKVYDTAFSTVLIAPDRYYAQGQITQRIFEALANSVIPFIPAEYEHVEDVAIEEFRVNGAEDVVRKIHHFKSLGDAYIRDLLAKQVERLACYAPNLQAEAALTALGLHRPNAR